MGTKESAQNVLNNLNKINASINNAITSSNISAGSLLGKKPPMPKDPAVSEAGGDDTVVDEEFREWQAEQEKLLASWADKAACYRWLHWNTFHKFKKWNYIMTIPVILLSTITGTANFGMESMFPNDKDVALLAVGSLSLLAGVLSTLSNFLKFAQDMESHRNAAVQWGKFHRNLSTELALHPDYRQEAPEFMKYCRREMDRLIEQSPEIPPDIVEMFKKEFEHLTDEEFSKPEICNGFQHTHVFDPSDRMRKTIADIYDDVDDGKYTDNLPGSLSQRLKKTSTISNLRNGASKFIMGLGRKAPETLETIQEMRRNADKAERELKKTLANVNVATRSAMYNGKKTIKKMERDADDAFNRMEQGVLDRIDDAGTQVSNGINTMERRAERVRMNVENGVATEGNRVKDRIRARMDDMIDAGGIEMSEMNTNINSAKNDMINRMNTEKDGIDGLTREKLNQLERMERFKESNEISLDKNVMANAFVEDGRSQIIRSSTEPNVSRTNINYSGNTSKSNVILFGGRNN